MSKRSQAPYSPQIGQAKNILYRKAHRRIKRAIQSGFYIEAIALLESLICDRMEAMLSKLTGGPVPVASLGQLRQQLIPYEVFTSQLNEQLKEWNKSRGEIVHQFVKILDSEEVSWHRRLAHSKVVAMDGLEILREVNNASGRLLRKKP